MQRFPVHLHEQAVDRARGGEAQDGEEALWHVPKGSGTRWLNDGAKTVFLYRLRVPSRLLGVCAHMGRSFPRWGCRQAVGLSCLGEPCAGGGSGDAPLNPVVVFGGGWGGNSAPRSSDFKKLLKSSIRKAET